MPRRWARASIGLTLQVVPTGGQDIAPRPCVFPFLLPTHPSPSPQGPCVGFPFLLPTHPSPSPLYSRSRGFHAAPHSPPGSYLCTCSPSFPGCPEGLTLSEAFLASHCETAPHYPCTPCPLTLPFASAALLCDLGKTHLCTRSSYVSTRLPAL